MSSDQEKVEDTGRIEAKPLLSHLTRSPNLIHFLVFQNPTGCMKNCPLIDLEVNGGSGQPGLVAPSLLHQDLAALGEAFRRSRHQMVLSRETRARLF
jgi:hypothetical protein